MIVAIVQARMNSFRLPGKVLLNIDNDKTVIDYVIDQLSHCKLLDKIVVATTESKEDDRVYQFVLQKGIACFRGSESDVLDRYYKCAKEYSADAIVRITCDDPLIDPTIVDKVVEEFKTGKWDMVTNVFPRTYPHGTEVELFSFNSLSTAWKKAKLPSEREHVLPYLYKNPQVFRIKNVEYSENISHLRWTIDRKEDLEFVRAVVARISKKPILLQDILNVINEDKSLLNINKDYDSTEGMKKSLENDKEFLTNQGSI